MRPPALLARAAIFFPVAHRAGAEHRPGRSALREQAGEEPTDAEEGGEIAGAGVDRAGYSGILPSKDAMKDVIGEKDETGQKHAEEGTGETAGRRPEQPAEEVEDLHLSFAAGSGSVVPLSGCFSFSSLVEQRPVGVAR